MPQGEASEPLGNESAMNVFTTSLCDNNTNKKANRHTVFHRDRYLFHFSKTPENRPAVKFKSVSTNTPLTKMSALQVVRTLFMGPRPFFLPLTGIDAVKKPCEQISQITFNGYQAEESRGIVSLAYDKSRF